MLTEELKEKIFKLLPLIESRYSLINPLDRGGLECFKISDKFVRYFCKSVANYEKEKEFLIEWKKLKVSQGSYKRQYFLDLQTEAGLLADKHNKPWLLALTPSGQAIAKCDFLKTPQCLDIMNSYNSDFHTAWLRESDQFCTQRFRNHDCSNLNDMIDIINKVGSECYEPLGFKQFKKYVKTEKRLYLKNLHDDWYIYIAHDLFNIKKGMNHMESFFGIVKIEKKTNNLFANNTVRSTFEYNDFISLNDAEFGHYLKSFNSPQELEAIIRINAFLYQQIVNRLDFENKITR